MKLLSTLSLIASGLFLTTFFAHAGGKGTVVTLGMLKSTTPADWKNQPPAGNLRMYQLAVGDAELLVFFFGENSGGDVATNIQRWKDTFLPPEGKNIDDVSKVEKFKVGSAEITCLDVHGTFLSKNPPFAPNAKTERKANYRRFGIYFACQGGPYFITLTGPAKTLEQNKKAFDDWLKNFK